MANCQCPPATNLTCQGSSGLGVFQPSCQVITTGESVSNPYYDSENNISYFTYGIFANCGYDNGEVTLYYLPICENIPPESVLAVDEFLDNCSMFQPINYDFTNDSGQQPPSGYKFIRILVNAGFQPGACALYRLSLAGRYDGESVTENTALILRTNGGLEKLFGASAPFLFASCPPIPRITVMKTCETQLNDNQATISYSVSVSNTGEVNFEDVAFSDTISYDSPNITIGPVTVSPDTISVDTSVSGIISLSGSLGALNVGSAIEITYSVPLQSIASPNTYTFNNIANAQSGSTEGSSECITSFEVVELTTNIACGVVNGNVVNLMSTYTNEPSSPATSITALSTINIPYGLTVQFTDFGDCTATDATTGDPIELMQDITNTTVNINCGFNVPAESFISIPTSLEVIGLYDFSVSEFNLTYTIQEITFTTDNQLNLGAGPLPNSITINVNEIFRCQN